MIVRASQLGQMESSVYLEFEKRVTIWLAAIFPDDCHWLGPQGTAERIRHSVQVAARYGFSSQRDIASFAYLSFLLGPNFDAEERYSWVRQILKRPNLPPGAPIDQAVDEVAARLDLGPLESLDFEEDEL
jgi:hypothetical protein